MTTTTQLRDWWAPACTGPFSRVALYGDGMVSVRPSIVDAVHALSACLEHYGYETRAADTGAYNCRKITGGTGYSLHSYGTAIDINWQSNPYGDDLITNMPPAMIAAIKAIRTRNGKQVWRWGGDYAGNKDAMHFEIVCHPADLSTGVDPATIPGAQPDPTPHPLMTSEDDMFTYTYDAAGAAPNVLVLVAGGKQIRLTGAQLLATREKAGDTHLGAVDADEAARFAKAFGPVIT